MSNEMYRVLIVDDEEKDRSIIRILLQRQYGDLFEILEASTVAEARELLDRQPADLLIADIHMPGVNGLTLVKDLRAQERKLYIVILTAFNYFEYAKEAIRYQVNDFILKPPIRKEFYDTIQRFLDWAREEKAGRQQVEPSRSIFVRELGDCIMLNADRKKIDAYRNLLNIRETRLFCILVDTSASKNLKATNFQDEIEAVMSSIGIPYAVSHTQDRTAIFCFTDQTTLRYDELSIPVELKMKLSLDLCETANITVSDTVSVYDRPSRAYRQAVTQLNSLSDAGRDEAPIEDTVVAAIRAGNTEQALREFGEFLLHYGEEHNIDDLMLKDIEALTVIRKSLQLHESQVPLKMVDIFVTGSVQDIVRFSSDYLRELAEKSPLNAAPKRHYAVQQICKRVEEHVEQPWTIGDFAKEYGFNPFYLSRLFKDETNLCFTDFLTEKRVEKAIALMADTNLSIGEIGLAVGYNDQNYFSRVFKRRTRMGPKEYRRTQAARTDSRCDE